MEPTQLKEQARGPQRKMMHVCLQRPQVFVQQQPSKKEEGCSLHEQKKTTDNTS